MPAIKDLGKLLCGLKPELVKGEYVFCTVSEKQLRELESTPRLIFREKEGVTVVLERKAAEKNGLRYSGKWAMITLAVHSDLEAVGLLAAVTKALAERGISVNAVSAYYHDHLFVPRNAAEKALKLLRFLSQKARRDKLSKDSHK